MRTFNEEGLELCKIQGRIFAGSRDKIKGSSYIFIRKYMNSKVCEKMDNLTYFYEQSDSYDEVNISKCGGVKISEDILYWVGYIYRYWAYTYEIPSKRIYKIINGKELVSLYGPYHTMDPSKAIERIYEHTKTKNPQSPVDLIRKNYKNILK